MFYQHLPVERVYYGVDVVKENLVNQLQLLNRKRVLIVTTNSLLKTAIFKNMIKLLHDNDFETYIKCSKKHVPGNYLMNDVNEIKQFKPNIILSCGGGSPIDAAKILSIVLAEKVESEVQLYDFSENEKGKLMNLENFIPHIAIPTTLSASEFTSIAGITNSSNHLKYKFSHINLTPKFVFLDPVFTVDTPNDLWTSTGIRAVDHAVETLYTPVPNPINNSLALQALKKLYNYLPLCAKNPENLEYRLECQLGAWLSLFSVPNIKLGLSHSIGHQLGALFRIPHGATSAIMLPHVMKFLLPSTTENQVQIVEVLGKYNSRYSVEENAAKASIVIRELIRVLEIPDRLSDYNVSLDKIPILADNILKDIHSENNEFVLNIENLPDEILNLVKNAW